MNTNVQQLRELWQEAFGDADAFLDCFFQNGFSPERCRTVTLEGQLACAIYWFDCEMEGQKLAYLYALATKKAFRGRGLAHKLMEEVEEHLRKQGFGGILLVPGSESLFRLYGSMGYKTCGYVREFTCDAGAASANLRQVDPEEYAVLRRRFLPPGGVVQEGENLAFLASIAELYSGDEFLLACSREGNTLRGLELLGEETAVPGILRALNCKKGTFRVPGKDRPLAMYLPLNCAAAPEYFGLAFD